MILTRPAGVLRLKADWLFIMARMGGEEKKNSKDFKKAAVERQTVAAVDTFPF